MPRRENRLVLPCPGNDVLPSSEELGKEGGISPWKGRSGIGTAQGIPGWGTVWTE